MPSREIVSLMLSFLYRYGQQEDRYADAMLITILELESSNALEVVLADLRPILKHCQASLRDPMPFAWVSSDLATIHPFPSSSF